MKKKDKSILRLHKAGPLTVLMTNFTELIPEEKRQVLEQFRIYLMMPKADGNLISEVKLLDTLLCAHERTKYLGKQLDDKASIKLWIDGTRQHKKDFRNSHKRIGEVGGLPDVFSGSASIKLGENMLITSSRTDKTRIDENNLALVTKFEPLSFSAEWVGERRPSSSTPWHWFIYKYFPDVQAILHTHWKKLTYDPKLEDYRTRLYVPYGTPDLGAEVVKVLEKTDQAKFAIIREHGEFALGWTLKQATDQLLKVAQEGFGED